MAISENDKLGELLSAYLDGELSEEETAFVEGTVLQDEEAGILLDELRRNAELVGSLPRHQAPPSICEDLQSQLERQELLESHELPLEVADHERRSWFAWLSMAAMVALVAISGVWMLSTVSTTSKDGKGRIASLDRQGATDDKNAIGEADSIAKFSPKKHRTRTRAARSGSEPTNRSAQTGGPTVEQKLAMGEPIESLRQHGFDAEPVRIRMVIPASDRRDAVARRLVTSLASNRAVNLQKPFKGKRRDRARAQSKGFFYEGGKGKNFAGANSRQILVRVPVSALDPLLRELGQGNQGIESIELAAGQLVYSGVSNIRSTLRLVDGESSAIDDPVARSRSLRSRKKPDHKSQDSTPPAPKASSFLRELSIALAEPKDQVGSESEMAKAEETVGPLEMPIEPAARPSPAANAARFVTLIVELRTGESAATRKAAPSKSSSAPGGNVKNGRPGKNATEKPIQ